MPAIRLFLSTFLGLSPDFLVVCFSVVPERFTGVSDFLQGNPSEDLPVKRVGFDLSGITGVGISQ